MNSGEDCRRSGNLYQLSATLRNTEGGPQEPLCSGCAQAYDQVRTNRSDLGLEPGVTGADLAEGRLLVEAALSPRLPLEMFDCICYVNHVSIDACFLEADV